MIVTIQIIRILNNNNNNELILKLEYKIKIYNCKWVQLNIGTNNSNQIYKIIYIKLFIKILSINNSEKGKKGRKKRS